MRSAAGVIGRMGAGGAAGSLSADERASRDAGTEVVDEDAVLFVAFADSDRLLSGCGIGIAGVTAAGRTDGWRRLLWEPFGRRPVACGRRRGRGIEACRGADSDGIWPTDATAEPHEDADCVRSRGKGSESGGGAIFADGVFRLEREGMRDAASVGPVLYDHDPASSSPTGVRGIATLEPETLEGVAIPASSLVYSKSCSLIWSSEGG